MQYLSYKGNKYLCEVCVFVYFWFVEVYVVDSRVVVVVFVFVVGVVWLGQRCGVVVVFCNRRFFYFFVLGVVLGYLVVYNERYIE